MSTPLTGQDIINQFENIIDDSPEGGSDYELFLMNMAKDEVEGGSDWNFNRGLQSSQTRATSDTYLTMKTLPTDFLTPRKLYVANDISPYLLISYEDRERFKDIYKRYYIDYLNGQYALCGGSGLVGTINFFYARQSPAITLISSPVWPAAFHPYLPFKMAEIWGSTSDADDINFRMSQQQLRVATSIYKKMKQWDASIKVAEYNAKNTIGQSLGTYPNVVGEDFVPN